LRSRRRARNLGTGADGRGHRCAVPRHAASSFRFSLEYASTLTRSGGLFAEICPRTGQPTHRALPRCNARKTGRGRSIAATSSRATGERPRARGSADLVQDAGDVNAFKRGSPAATEKRAAQLVRAAIRAARQRETARNRREPLGSFVSKNRASTRRERLFQVVRLPPAPPLFPAPRPVAPRAQGTGVRPLVALPTWWGGLGGVEPRPAPP